jgi:hypothetical protein
MNMTRSKTSVLLVLALLATFTLGCGLLDSLTKKATEKGAEVVEQAKATAESVVTQAVSSQAPSKEATQAPTAEEATAEPTEVAEAKAEETVDLSDVGDFEALDSYRMVVTMTWKEVKADGTTEEGTMEMLNEYDRASQSRRFKISGSAPDSEGVAAGEAGELEMIQIGTTSYMRSNGEWMAAQLEDDADDQMNWMSDPDDFTSGEGTYVGKETANGVSAKHYHYVEAGVGGMGIGFGAADRAESDVWVSEEHNVVVKAVIEWEGKDVEGTQWTGSMGLDVTDINEPIVIEAPEGVEPPGMPEDVPLMEGATNVESVMGINTFNVAVSADEVIAFYDEEMAANGWEAEDSGIPTMRTYVKGDRQAMLMVEETDGGCEVTIMIGEQ